MGATAKSERTRLIGAVHAEWARIYPFAHDDKETIREARIKWIRDALGWPTLESLRQLSDRQLRLVLVLMKHPEAIKRASNLPAPEPQPGNVHHLATEGQTWAIGKVFDHLEYDPAARRAFLTQKFGRESERWLTPKQANAAIQTLLYRAAYRRVRAERLASGDSSTAPVTQAEKNRVLPAIKAELGFKKS